MESSNQPDKDFNKRPEASPEPSMPEELRELDNFFQLAAQTVFGVLYLKVPAGQYAASVEPELPIRDLDKKLDNKVDLIVVTAYDRSSHTYYPDEYWLEFSSTGPSGYKGYLLTMSKKFLWVPSEQSLTSTIDSYITSAKDENVWTKIDLQSDPYGHLFRKGENKAFRHKFQMASSMYYDQIDEWQIGQIYEGLSALIHKRRLDQ